jgi:trehalose synthase
MKGVRDIPVAQLDPHRFESVSTPEDYAALVKLIDRAARRLRGSVIWNVNSTASGGGVAELLRPLLGYCRGSGVDARWAVISGGPSFFNLTKRLHNHLHGFDGDGGNVSDGERGVYEATLAANARDLGALLRPDDVVILHDPQTAGLVEAVKRTGATVIWRCHVGLDHPNALARGAWDFLRPYVLDADAYVFSRPTFAWDGLERRKVSVIHPSIDAFSAKNQDQTPEQAQAILTRAGIVAGRCDGATFVRDDGTPGRVDRQATVLQAATLAPDDRTVVQISRWDALKDPVGVIAGFAERVAGRSDAHLVLAGPSTDAVADDPEGAKVLQQAVKAWERLPRSTQRRVHLASLPMADADENAAIVNALQRHADVVVQKSVAEGFGLTVAEAMWKARPVVASAIGGIQDQIVDGESGVLLADPLDLTTFGDEVSALLRDPERANQIGTAARQRVRQRFLGPHHLGRFFDLIETVTARPESVANCVR